VRLRGGESVFLFDANAGDKGCQHGTKTGAHGKSWAAAVGFGHTRSGSDLSRQRVGRAVGFGALAHARPIEGKRLVGLRPLRPSGQHYYCGPGPFNNSL
jgi:hypothetical protein